MDAEANGMPFTEEDILEKMEVVRYWAKRIEDLKKEGVKIQTKELKEAYELVYRDYKWKILLSIRDLWFWFMATDDKLPTAIRGEGNIPQESRPPTESA